MEDLFEEFETLPKQEDTVDLNAVTVPEDDFFVAPEEEIEYPTYGGIEEIKYPIYDFKTKGGKTIEVYHEQVGTLWAIRFKEGGQLPRELKGKYTTEANAVQAVQLYVANNN
jgi:hypothetical protein